MSGLKLADSWRIGFNDSIDVGGKSLHIQTEVLTARGVAIRTAVYDGGVAKWVEKLPLPPDVTDMQALEALVRNQHQRCIDHVKRAGVAWLESI
jgi:hypothetical protein